MEEVKTIIWKDLTSEQRNAIVHEKVLEQDLNKQCDLDSHSEMELRIYDSGDAFCPLCHVYEHINSFEHGIIPPPDYSTNMQAAWLIVDFLKGQYIVQIGTSDQWYYTELRDPHARRIEGYRLLYMSTAETPAEAICMAALRAKGYEVVTE